MKLRSEIDVTFYVKFLQFHLARYHLICSIVLMQLISIPKQKKEILFSKFNFIFEDEGTFYVFINHGKIVLYLDYKEAK